MSKFTDQLNDSIVNPIAGTAKYYIVTKDYKAVDRTPDKVAGYKITVSKKHAAIFSTREEAEYRIGLWVAGDAGWDGKKRRGIDPHTLSVSMYAEGWS
jgi:hypothetical protein